MPVSEGDAGVGVNEKNDLFKEEAVFFRAAKLLASASRVASASTVAKAEGSSAIATEQKQNQNPAPIIPKTITIAAAATSVIREQTEENDQKTNVILATHNCRLLK